MFYFNQYKLDNISINWYNREIMTYILSSPIEFTDPFDANRDIYKYSHHEEIDTLATEGIDAKLVDVIDPHALDAVKQEQVDTEIERLESTGVDFTAELFDEETHPSGNAWFPLNKRAIALHTLYNASTIKTLGDGIKESAYDVPLFSGKSARQVITAEKTPEKASTILNSYDRFVSAEIEPDQEGWLSSRDYFRGVKDAIAVRRRAILAMDVAIEHVLSGPLKEKTDIVSASLACGAAQPIYDLDKRLAEARGVGLSKTILVDNDVMALASAWSLAEGHGNTDIVDIKRQDLIKDKITEYIEPQSVDIVDLLGIFEYIPKNVKLGGVVNYRAAEALLSSVRDVVKPGGVIILGNMLTERPQQGFFNYVWPKLEQRTMSDVLDIIEGAGFNREDVVVRAPSEDAIYAVYAIKVPETGLTRKAPRQRLAKWLVAHS